MISFNVLITSISKKVPLIKSVLRALESVCPTTSSFSPKIIGGDCNFHAIGRYFVDEFWHMPVQEALNIDDIIDFCKNHGVKAIIPTRDGELPFFSRYKERLASEGIHCLVSSEKTVDICRDKLQFYNFLAKHHLPVIPTFETIDSFWANSFVVKERFGAGSHSLGLDLPLAEAKQWKGKLKHPIYQPYIHGTEFSVDLYVDSKGSCLGSIAREREVICDGESQVTASLRHLEIETLCRQAASLLNIIGPAVFQILLDQSKHLHLIECNPRFGGASTLSVAMGLTIFEWFFQEILNNRLTPFQRSSHELRQVRYAEDLIMRV